MGAGRDAENKGGPGIGGDHRENKGGTLGTKWNTLQLCRSPICGDLCIFVYTERRVSLCMSRDDKV